MELLRERMEQLASEGLAIAFSGGTDSSLLLKLACGTGYPVQAVLLHSQLQPLRDLAIAQRVAEECGASLTVLEADLSSVPAVMENRPDRCYHCKKAMFSALRHWCEAQGIPHIADGTNADDLLVYRPGLKAVRELGIVSPLAERGLSKAQVRAMAEKLGISVAQRPSAPCMATRLPYDTPLDFSLLRKLEEGEQLLKEAGFPVCRLRLHGQVLRIEVAKERLSDFVRQAEELTERLKSLGFSYITLDLEGFRSGSMDLGR
ncbi:MAG: ATP-dependent sacrificial sulfur transferase LarE [Oscillospiraceae bacterium]|nr:ATP-dependent sacrificial sulfur transferase LarE [Oscillospiraceae bacterium]